jgi:hypothetical protein
MNGKIDNRNKFLHIRMKETEYEEVSKQLACTMDQTLSEFARKKLLDKPVVQKCRNVSVDECMTGLILLRNDLAAAGSHFTQLAGQLSELHGEEQFSAWKEQHEKYTSAFFDKINEIKEQVNKISEAWLQTSTVENQSGRP